MIFESCYLSERRTIAARRICSEVGVDFVKTSTRYGTGGVRTLERALDGRELDWTRFGCTATAGILDRLT